VTQEKEIAATLDARRTIYALAGTWQLQQPAIDGIIFIIIGLFTPYYRYYFLLLVFSVDALDRSRALSLASWECLSGPASLLAARRKDLDLDQTSQFCDHSVSHSCQAEWMAMVQRSPSTADDGGAVESFGL
jgi:hypothetical protein